MGGSYRSKGMERTDFMTAPSSSEAREKPLALIVAGPTASGKSALALRLAEELKGTIINADSLQVYRELSILTARPSEEERTRAPHRLYGVLSVQENCSEIGRASCREGGSSRERRRRW